MKRTRRLQDAAEAHWTRVGRDLAEDLEGLDKADRLARIKQAAAALGIAPHTIQRYVVLSGFLHQLHVPEPMLSRLGVAQIEVILRIWSVDPEAALSALRQAQAGTLTFRRALELERKVKAKLGSTGAAAQFSVQHASSTQDWLRGGVDLDPLIDPRFAMAPVHRIVLRDQVRVAVIDESLIITRVAGVRDFPSLARAILQATALFEEVVVLVASAPSIEKLNRLRSMCLPSVEGRIHVDTTRLDYGSGRMLED